MSGNLERFARPVRVEDYPINLEVIGALPALYLATRAAFASARAAWASLPEVATDGDRVALAATARLQFTTMLQVVYAEGVPPHLSFAVLELGQAVAQAASFVSALHLRAVIAGRLSAAESATVLGLTSWHSLDFAVPEWDYPQDPHTPFEGPGVPDLPGEVNLAAVSGPWEPTLVALRAELPVGAGVGDVWERFGAGPEEIEDPHRLDLDEGPTPGLFQFELVSVEVVRDAVALLSWPDPAASSALLACSRALATPWERAFLQQLVARLIEPRVHAPLFGAQLQPAVRSAVLAVGRSSLLPEDRVQAFRAGLDSTLLPWVARAIVDVVARRSATLRELQVQIDPLVLASSAEALAIALASGIGDDVATRAIGRFAVEFQATIEQERAGMPSLPARLLSAYQAGVREVGPVLHTVETWATILREWVYENAVPIAPFEWLLHIVSRLGAQIAQAGQMAVSALVAALRVTLPQESVLWESVGLVVCAAMDIIDPRHRQHPKAVWAMMFRASGAWLNASDAMMMSLPEMSYIPPADYQEWAGTMIGLLNATYKTDLPALNAEPPRRLTFLPRDTYGHEALRPYMANLEGRLIETERERSRLDSLLAHGAAQGIDGAWVAQAPDVVESLSRYLSPTKSLAPLDRIRLREAADALASEYPEMYGQARPMTVGAVMSAMKWKFSAGLPFLGVVKTKRQLQTSGWFMRIRHAAERILATGRHPGIAFHGFPKADVVPLEKALLAGNVRTITAQDVVTGIAANVVMMEKNKRVPPPRAMVANMMPRTEAGMSDLWTAIAKRADIFTGDMWHFDSTVVPDVPLVGSVRLWEHAFAGRWGDKAALSVVEAYYAAILTGIIVALPDGSTIRKVGGGGTGSVGTATDNRDWVRLIMIAAWSAFEHRPASEFFRSVTLANAADDLAFSVDGWSDARAQEFTEFLRVHYGVVLRLDRAPSTGPEGFLHLRVVPVEELDAAMYARVRTPLPEFGLASDQSRLMMKRTAYRSDRANSHTDQTLDYLVSRGIGHLLLTAHHPSVYSELAAEIMEDVTDRLRMWFSSVEWEVDRGEDGLILAAKVVGLGSLSPGLARRLVRRRSDVAAGEAAIRKMATRWLRANRVPSYVDVFRAWVTKHTPRSGAAARYKRISMIADASFPLTDVARLWIIRVRGGVLSLAGALSKANPEPVGLPPTRPFSMSYYWIEMFIWGHAVKRLGRRPTPDEFRLAVRESPYAAATDVLGFLWRLDEPEFFRRAMRLSGPKSGHATAAMIVYTVVYVLLDWTIGWFARSRFIGWVIHLWLLSNELNIVYAILGNLYWLGTGTASVTISNLIPRDPYAFQKQLAAVLVGCLPDWAFQWYGAERFVEGFPFIVRGATTYFQAKTLVAQRFNRALVEPSDHWDAMAAAVASSMSGAQLPVARVEAPTGSGKSTHFVGALLRTATIAEVWVLCPTRLSRDEYTNDTVGEGDIQRIDRSRPFVEGPRVVVCTYGHALHCRDLWQRKPGVLMFFDEFHLASTEICLMFLQVKPRNRLLVSATPDGLLAPRAIGQVLTNPAVRRFETVVDVVAADEVALLEEALKRHPEGIRRALLIHPVERKCVEFASLLRRAGVPASVLSRAHPVPAMAGAIVATTIADVGVTIQPPPTLLVDFGWSMEVEPVARPTPDHRGQPRLVPSSWATALQRAGRVGRISAGHVLANARAGTGPPQRRSVSPYWYFRYPAVAPLLGHLTAAYLVCGRGIADRSGMEWMGYDETIGVFSPFSPEVAWGRVVVFAMMDGASFREVHTWILEREEGLRVSDVLSYALEAVAEAGFDIGTAPPPYDVLAMFCRDPPWFFWVGTQKVYSWGVGLRYTVKNGSEVGIIGPLTLQLEGIPDPRLDDSPGAISPEEFHRYLERARV